MSDNLPVHPEGKRFEDMNKVMDLYVKATPIREIMSELKMTRAEVNGYIQEWRDSAVGGQFLKDRVTELIAVLDEHYSVIIDGIWQTVKEVDAEIQDKGATPQLIAQRLSAFKLAADTDAKRVDTLQKAGLLEAAEIGDEMIEMEMRQQQLIDILKEVSFQCEVCAPQIAVKLSHITGQAVAYQTVDGETE